MRKTTPTPTLNEQTEIKELKNLTLDQSLFHACIESITGTDELKKKLIIDSENQKNFLKEEECFSLIKINRDKLDVSLTKLFRTLNVGRSKLLPANDMELVLFSRGFRKSLYQIFFGMTIVILEKEEIRHGFPKYLVIESGIFGDEIKFIDEKTLLKKKTFFRRMRKLYALAKENKTKVLNQEFVREVMSRERQITIEKCKKRLAGIKVRLEVTKEPYLNLYKNNVSPICREISKLAVDLDDLDLTKMVEDVRQMLCRNYDSVK